MQGKQLLIILVGVVVLIFGAKYYTQTVQESEACNEDVLESLPDCAVQQKIGSNVMVKNQCGFDITVHWDVSGASDHLIDLAPGSEKQISAFPLKIQRVSCCPEYNRCF